MPPPYDKKITSDRPPARPTQRPVTRWKITGCDATGTYPAQTLTTVGPVVSSSSTGDPPEPSVPGGVSPRPDRSAGAAPGCVARPGSNCAAATPPEPPPDPAAGTDPVAGADPAPDTDPV